MSQGNQRGSGEILEPIPTDLINEIFSRLPAKSAVRFRCLSKLWGSMLHRPYFNELFLTKSLARPRLLLAVIEQSSKCSFFSLPQLQSPCEKSSSLVVAADFHIKFPPGEMTISYDSDLRYFSFGYASGLIYFSDMWPTKNDYKHVICNPITGQYATLPKLWRYRKSFSFLGFDPIDKQVKVLFVAYPGCSDDNRILTFRTGKMRWRRSWRKIECPSRHEPLSNGICINGVVYYLAEDFPAFVIVCFDVRSEKFMFVNFNGFEHFGGTECNFSEENCPCGPCSCGKTVINYKGKLCVICWKTIGAEAMEFRMWVLEDIGRQDLSEYAYTLPVSEFGHEDVSVVGMTARGEIVFHNNRYVFYFNPERNTLQTVEIQGLVNGGTVLVFMDHVEDLNVIDGKLLKSSIFAPSVKNKAT